MFEVAADAGADEIADLEHRFVHDGINLRRTFPVRLNDPGRGEHPEVLARSGMAEARLPGQLRHVPRPLLEPEEQADAVLFSKSPEAAGGLFDHAWGEFFRHACPLLRI